MNPRTGRLWAVILTLIVAVTIIVLGVLAQLAHSDYAVPLSDFLTNYSARTWAVVAVVAFLVGLGVLLVVALRPNLVFQVQELSDRTLKPQLHIRCSNCGVVQRMEDSGERPLKHFCAKCGNTGEYAGPESGEKGFIYTRIEMKIGCTRCKTTFRIPEPLVRPLFTECPNCHVKGVLRSDQRPKDAQELPLRCYSCGHGYHIYAVKGHWADRFPCPSCGVENPLPTEGGAAPVSAPA